jgi:hypothetical protein
MPVERDNDEERLERIKALVQRSAEQLRDNRSRACGRWHGDSQGDGQSSPGLAWLPAGYRVVSGNPTESVECDRGCGWRQTVETLMALPAAARHQLFRCHEDWHVNRR